MARLVAWIQAFATSIGGPGLFFVAFLDSSFLSLPEINDVLVITTVIAHKDRMVFYALMATLGSISGCLVLYVLGRRGGEVFVRRRFGGARLDRAMELTNRYGILAIAVPAILPPPAPFKVFVLLAGVAKLPILKFVSAIAVGRGFRYFLEAWLAVRYGDQAIELLERNGQIVGFSIAGLLLGGGLTYYLWRKRR